MRHLALSLLVGFVLAIAPPAQGQIGFRQLTSTHPVAIQVGTEREIRVRSNFTLDGAYQVFFDRPGITMTYAETEPKAAPRRGRASPGTPFKFKVSVPKDQVPGVYEFRVATRKAVSSVGQLLVTDLPVVEEKSGQNGSPREGQKVTIPVAICGTCDPAEDVDFYLFEGRKGQRITMQVYAQRVTDRLHNMVVRGPSIYLMDPILTLYGPTGAVVAQNDNFFGGDSLIHIELPQSGVYALEVRDARYAGNPRYTYCVEITDQPHCLLTYPMAVRKGERRDVEPVGFGFPQGTNLVLDGTERDAGWHWDRITTGDGTPTNPIWFRVSEFDELVENPDNDDIATAMVLEQLPVGVSGRLEKPEDVDFYAFNATKGAYYRIETEAARYRAAVDTVLEIYNADGKLLASTDDIAFSKDSRLYWQAPADGKYFVAVRDLHGRTGPRMLYHLVVQPTGPDFEMRGEYYYAFLAPGTRMIWFARITRLAGFTGPVEIGIEGLPKGVRMVPTRIPAGMNHCSIILEADKDAPVNASLVRIFGKAVVKKPDGTEEEIKRYGIVTCEQQSSGGGQARYPINTQIVGVTEPLDLKAVVASPEEIVLHPGEKAEIAVRIERNEGFTAPVTLDVQFKYFSSVLGDQLPPGVRLGSGSQLRLAGDQLEGKVVLECASNALPVERLPIAVIARVPITFSITTNYASNPIYLTVKPKKQ